jgi:hypothetical protein
VVIAREHSRARTLCQPSWTTFDSRTQPTLCLLTNICTPLQDIHPTDLGYAVLAGLVLEQYVFGPPFGV